MQQAVYAQPHELIDSLRNELAKAKEDTNKAKLLYKLAMKMGGQFNFDEAIGYMKQHLELAKRSGMPQVKGFHVLGIFYARQSDYPKALENFLEALKIYESDSDKHGIESINGNIGNVYENQKDYKKALEYHLKALKLAEELGDKEAMSRNQNNAGNAYGLLGDHAKELEYYRKSIVISEELGDKSSVAMGFVNIGTSYEAQDDQLSALDNFLKAIALAKKIGDAYTLSKAYANAAVSYMNQAYKNKRDKTNKGGSVSELLIKGRAVTDSAIAINKEAGDLHGLMECHYNLYKIDSLQGNFAGALNAHLQYMMYRDSIFNGENNIKINQLETKRMLELKDKQIELDKLAVAKKRNERVFYIIGIALLFVVIGIVVRNLVVQKKTNALLSKEKQRSEDLLLNILPTEVAEELKEKGVADAKHFDNVTVLFTDFVNFTTAGEKMTPQELIDELHACFKAFDEIIGNHDIEKIKTIGDAYLAVSGLPLPIEKHAENIVDAALQIRDFMVARKKELGDKTFDIRVGVHSGSVVAGIVGVKKFAYDIWGDTVNTAARMEQNSEGGKINISQTTYEMVKDKYTCTYRGELDAKNKGKLKMYFVEQILIA
jgi:adenylate cyclase